MRGEGDQKEARGGERPEGGGRGGELGGCGEEVGRGGRPTERLRSIAEEGARTSAAHGSKTRNLETQSESSSRNNRTRAGIIKNRKLISIRKKKSPAKSWLSPPRGGHLMAGGCSQRSFLRTMPRFDLMRLHGIVPIAHSRPHPLSRSLAQSQHSSIVQSIHYPSPHPSPSHSTPHM